MNPLDKVTAIVLVFFALSGVYLLVMECVEALDRYKRTKQLYEEMNIRRERFISMEREIDRVLASIADAPEEPKIKFGSIAEPGPVVTKRKRGRPRKTA